MDERAEGDELLEYGDKVDRQFRESSEKKEPIEKQIFLGSQSNVLSKLVPHVFDHSDL